MNLVSLEDTRLKRVDMTEIMIYCSFIKDLLNYVVTLHMIPGPVFVFITL